MGATISAIVGLNKDIKELPASLLPARAGLDDFKSSFSDLNSVITERAFADSEQAWRSLGSTVRGLSPAFGVVGDSVGTILDELADGLAPGTRNFENLVTVVEGSADDFEQLAGSVGRLGEGLLSAFANPEKKNTMSIPVRNPENSPRSSGVRKNSVTIVPALMPIAPTSVNRPPPNRSQSGPAIVRVAAPSAGPMNA